MAYIIEPDLWSHLEQFEAMTNGWGLFFSPTTNQWFIGTSKIAKAARMGVTFDAAFASNEEARAHVEQLADDGDGLASRALVALAAAVMGGQKVTWGPLAVEQEPPNDQT